MKSIVWLASYPKSGNTWTRAFLANYIMDAKQPLSINKIHQIGIGDASDKAYEMVSQGPFNPADPVQSAQLRYAVLKGIVNNRADVNLVKTHNENSTAFGIKLVPFEFTRCAIYIIRNPLDMVISFASHYAKTVDQTIHSIGNSNNILLGSMGAVCQFLGGWSNHVMSWAKARKFPVLILRYEDMLNDPHSTFGHAIRHIGLPENDDRLDRAVRFSDFKVLRQQEDKAGFIENTKNQKNFFRKGQSGQWKSELTQEQIDRILKDHGRIMKKFGYEV